MSIEFDIVLIFRFWVEPDCGTIDKSHVSNVMEQMNKETPNPKFEFDGKLEDSGIGFHLAEQCSFCVVRSPQWSTHFAVIDQWPEDLFMYGYDDR